mmetsp:Transcript_18705/g.58329  ORF Transcript_18705/g.58329 Transcript_18705/m.58329 type:complete len:248 (-) Transcript_18705:132-875(-)
MWHCPLSTRSREVHRRAVALDRGNAPPLTGRVRLPHAHCTVVSARCEERAGRVPLDAPHGVAVVEQPRGKFRLPRRRRVDARGRRAQRVHVHGAIAPTRRDQLHRTSDVRRPRDGLDCVARVRQLCHLRPLATTVVGRDGGGAIREADNQVRRPRRVLAPCEAARARHVDLVHAAPLAELHHVMRLIHAQLAVGGKRAQPQAEMPGRKRDRRDALFRVAQYRFARPRTTARPAGRLLPDVDRPIERA